MTSRPTTRNAEGCLSGGRKMLPDGNLDVLKEIKEH